MIAIGLMSGTSLDGIDAALVRIVPSRAGRPAIEVLDARTTPFAPALRARLLAVLPPNTGNLAELAALHVLLGEAFAAAAQAIRGAATVAYIASHGLTVYHDGARAITLQIGDPAVIAERTGTTVVADFRRADCAAGGNGAPLVPAVDRLLFHDPSRDRVAVNIGGIANITLLPAAEAPVTAFDTGPGNLLIDALVRERSGGAETFDRDGAYAAQGNVDRALLHRLLADPYFAQPPPKSTGRERFGTALLAQHRAALDALSLRDAAATLTAFTAQSLAAAIGAALPRAQVLVAGGGVHNTTLMRGLAAALPDAEVTSTAALGVDPDAKEALAFALLGYETLRERPAGLASVTGARHDTVLGTIVPRGFAALLSELRAEMDGKQ